MAPVDGMRMGDGRRRATVEARQDTVDMTHLILALIALHKAQYDRAGGTIGTLGTTVPFALSPHVMSTRCFTRFFKRGRRRCVRCTELVSTEAVAFLRAWYRVNAEDVTFSGK